MVLEVESLDSCFFDSEGDVRHFFVSSVSLLGYPLVLFARVPFRREVGRSYAPCGSRRPHLCATFWASLFVAACNDAAVSNSELVSAHGSVVHATCFDAAVDCVVAEGACIRITGSAASRCHPLVLCAWMPIWRLVGHAYASCGFRGPHLRATLWADMLVAACNDAAIPDAELVPADGSMINATCFDAAVDRTVAKWTCICVACCPASSCASGPRAIRLRRT